MEQEKRNFIQRNIRLIIFVIAFEIFTNIIEDIFENDICNFDNNVYAYVLLFENPTLTSIFKVFTNLGSGIMMIPICILLFIVIKDKIKPAFIIFNLAIAALLNYILKNIIDRPRPSQYRLIDVSGYSFPSGHSMVSMAFYGFIIYLVFKNVKNNYIKWGVSTTLSVLIILIGISRIYLGVHYASDVLGGFLLAILYLTIYTNIYKKVIIQHEKHKDMEVEKTTPNMQ